MPLSDPFQELRFHVLADQPIRTAKRDRRRPEGASLPEIQCCQIQPDWPPFGPLMQCRHVILAERHLG